MNDHRLLLDLLSWTLGVAAVAMVAWSLWGRRGRSAEPRCPKCDHEVGPQFEQGLPLTCPECGRSVAGSRVLRRVRKRRRWMLRRLAIVALLAVPLVQRGHALPQRGWVALVPTPVLIVITPHTDALQAPTLVSGIQRPVAPGPANLRPSPLPGMPPPPPTPITPTPITQPPTTPAQPTTLMDRILERLRHEFVFERIGSRDTAPWMHRIALESYIGQTGERVWWDPSGSMYGDEVITLCTVAADNAEAWVALVETTLERGADDALLVGDVWPEGEPLQGLMRMPVPLRLLPSLPFRVTTGGEHVSGISARELAYRREMARDRGRDWSNQQPRQPGSLRTIRPVASGWNIAYERVPITRDASSKTARLEVEAWSGTWPDPIRRTVAAMRTQRSVREVPLDETIEPAAAPALERFITNTLRTTVEWQVINKHSGERIVPGHLWVELALRYAPIELKVGQATQSTISAMDGVAFALRVELIDDQGTVRNWATIEQPGLASSAAQPIQPMHRPSPFGHRPVKERVRFFVRHADRLDTLDAWTIRITGDRGLAMDDPCATRWWDGSITLRLADIGIPTKPQSQPAPPAGASGP